MSFYVKIWIFLMKIWIFDIIKCFLHFFETKSRINPKHFSKPGRQPIAGNDFVWHPTEKVDKGFGFKAFEKECRTVKALVLNEDEPALARRQAVQRQKE